MPRKWIIAVTLAATLGCEHAVEKPSPTCDDGTQNGDEIGIDCGGSCPTCESAQMRLDQDGDGFCASLHGCNDGSATGDCDEASPEVYPGATEQPCNDIDDNCDDTIDETRVDADADGFDVCVDCDDQTDTANPDAAEECDGFDNNCNDEVDEGCAPNVPPSATTTAVWMKENTKKQITLEYVDSDGDLAVSCSVSFSGPELSETTLCSCDAAGICTVGLQACNHCNSAYPSGLSFDYTVSDAADTSAPQRVTVSIPSEIYRSVELGATSALADGSANPLTITANATTGVTEANFSAALPDYVGVGDVLIYDADGNGGRESVAFIHGRASAFQYAVKTASGGLAATTAADVTDWLLFRAYTDVIAAESGLENSGIDAALADFDSWTDGKNIVTADQAWNIAIYGTGNVLGSADLFSIRDWITDANHYLTIYTPYETEQVGIRQRHEGKLDTVNYATFSTSDVVNVFSVGTYISHVHIDGIQAVVHPLANYSRGIYLSTVVGVRVSNNIIVGNSDNDQYGIQVHSPLTTGANYFWNNIVSGFFNHADAAGLLVTLSGDQHLYNNTFHLCRTGVARTATSLTGTTYLKNTLFSAVETHTSATSGSTPETNSCAAASFVDMAAGNFHLAADDTGARNQGVDLSDDADLSFSTDIDGELRSDGAWDCGADEYLP